MKKLTKIQMLGIIVFGAGILFNGATLANSVISDHPDINFYSESLMPAYDQHFWKAYGNTAITETSPYKDTINGLNILSESWQIEADKKLTVNFDDESIEFDSVWITESFINGSENSFELGLPRLSDADNKFYEYMLGRNESAQTDGEIYVSFDLPSGFKVTKTTFMIHKKEKDNEFVAGFDESPEPVTMLFLGFGLVGLTSFRKKFMKKSKLTLLSNFSKEC